MRPTNHTITSPTNTTNPWNFPIPYLFGSLAIVLVLIAVALIMLACSYKKQSSSSNSASDNNASDKPAILLKVLDPEPKIVVIMAGDEKPSFLARPAVSSTICRCDEQV